MPLSDIQIKRAKPAEKPFTLNDGNGLSLLVETSGGKGWRFRYRFAGKPKMISFGVYPTVSLADARARREEAKSQLARGINPSEARKAGKLAQMSAAGNTFKAIALEWHAAKKASWTENYAQSVIRLLELNIFPFLGERAIDGIQPLELLLVLQKIEGRGAIELASKVRQRCGEVFRYAVITGRATYNPAPDLAGALQTPKRNHYPFLMANELPAFIKALDSYSGSIITKLATQLLMLTGTRTIELRAARWEEFDLENALWEIPAERMKMKRPHLVPLSTQAVEILRQLETLTGRYQLVFPGRNDASKPMSEGSINKALKLIGYHGKATGHGFRHTMSTILHEQGFDSTWIEMQLAHVDKNSIRSTYNHAQYLNGRTSMMQWYSTHLISLG
ncbi:tyrosine-type recombinase/integrase [Rahnella variigena]|uniref:tyrosine-type recombinase/integrase n=1 Tax=Rahnella variigena TaxID=574964 RepID=UPI0013303C07|nr:tyrosine-type recombinase/integrase [Rahnella variigena]